MPVQLIMSLGPACWCICRRENHVLYGSVSQMFVFVTCSYIHGLWIVSYFETSLEYMLWQRLLIVFSHFMSMYMWRQKLVDNWLSSEELMKLLIHSLAFSHLAEMYLSVGPQSLSMMITFKFRENVCNCAVVLEWCMVLYIFPYKCFAEKTLMAFISISDQASLFLYVHYCETITAPYCANWSWSTSNLTCLDYFLFTGGTISLLTFFINLFKHIQILRL